jgi:hypothetical protein
MGEVPRHGGVDPEGDGGVVKPETRWIAGFRQGRVVVRGGGIEGGHGDC